MKKLMDKRCQALLEEVLAEFGVTSYSLDHGGRHPLMTFTFQGKEYKQPLPGKPGDHRTPLNMRSQLRAKLSSIKQGTYTAIRARDRGGV